MKHGTTIASANRMAVTAGPQPACAGLSARDRRLPLVRLTFVALLTGLFAHAQLTAATMWTLVTGQGAYDAPAVAWSGLLIYGIGAAIVLAAPRYSLRCVEQDSAFRWLTAISVLLGFSIVYPAGFHYFYDLPRGLFISTALLTLVLGILSLRWCRCLIPFSFLVTLAIGSFLNVPHYTWDITDLRHTLNVLSILNGFVVVTAIIRWHEAGWRGPGVLWARARGSGRTRENEAESRQVDSPYAPDRLTLLVLTGFGCIIGYFYAGFGKVAISSQSIWMVDGVRWIWLERLDKFFQLFFHMGCTWLVPTYSAQEVYDWLGEPWVRCSACAVVLFGELAVILLLFSRRLCFAGLVACQILHIGFTLICGTYFSHWFLVNLIFMLLFSKKNFEQICRQWTWFERLGITAGAIFLCPLIFHTSVLAWSTDRARAEIFTWHASPLLGNATLAETGVIGEPQLDPNLLFPYEKSFQMSWRFARLIDSFSRTSSAADSQPHNVVARFGQWYKLRMVGEWHEHLPRHVTEQSLQEDLARLLTRFHERQRAPPSIGLPVYFSHMAYNWRLLPNRSVLRSEPINSYVLLRQELKDDHSCVYLAASPVTLCRISVPIEIARTRFSQD